MTADLEAVTRRRVLGALRTGRARAEAANSARIIACHPNKPGWNAAEWNREHPSVDVDEAMADAVLAVLASLPDDRLSEAEAKVQRVETLADEWQSEAEEAGDVEWAAVVSGIARQIRAALSGSAA